MGKKRTIEPQIARSYDDAFEAFNDIIIKGKKSNTGFGSLGSAAASTFRGYNTGIGQSKYDKNLSWNANIDEEDVQGSLNEYRSQQQGAWGELGAGVGRVTSKVGRELVKTVGAIGGAGVGIIGNIEDAVTGKDSTDFLDTTFNNSFIKATDKAFENANSELLPVYVSDTVTNGGFFDKVTSGEFWATEGADGVGYLISAFAPGAALKSLNASNKLFGGLTKLNSLRYGKSLDISRRALSKAGVTIDKIDDIIVPMANTFFEAGAESKGAADSMDARRPEMEANYPNIQLERLQEVDTRRKNGEISIQEANILSKEISDKPFEVEFNEQKSKASRNTFLTNLLILAGPNYIQSKILYGKNGATNLLNNVIKKNPIKQGLKRVGETFLTEGSEEVAQTSTEHRNVEKGLKGELSDTFIQDVNPLTFGKDFIKSLGTTEGQVAGFLGGILGSPISVVQGFRQDSKDQVRNDALRGKIQTTGTSLNDIHLPIYQTETTQHPETGEDIEVYKEDEKGNKILIPENVAKVKQALDLHEEVSKLYDSAVERGDVEAIDKLKKYGEHELIMNFISEDEMTIDALQEHLKSTMPIAGIDAKTAKDNLKRQSEIIDKAKYLQKELVSFKDMSVSLVKLNNKNATKEQVRSFMNDLSNEFIKETSEIYDNRNRLNELNKLKAELEKFTTFENIDNIDYDESKNEPIYKKINVRKNPRLDLINSKIEAIEKELADASSFLDYGIWNSKIVNGAFDNMVNSITELKVATSPEVVKSSDNIIEAIKNAKTLTELDDIDTQNNPDFTPYYTAKKAELEAVKTKSTLETINQEIAGEENEELEAAENKELVKSYAKSSKVGNIELNPFTLQDATVTEITKNSITLTDILTNESFTYEFEQDISDDNSADDVDPTKVSVIAAGATHSDHKTVGYDNNNASFADYLMEPRNKVGDIVTFELNELNLSPEGKKAIDIINDGTNIIGNRQLLIDTLPINFVYNNGQAKSWSAFKGPNAIKLRTNIVDAIINGAKLSELKTIVTNQESASFNTKFENGKPVVNNPLEIDFIKTLDGNNPENKVTLYNVNAEGVLIIVSNNKLALSADTKKDLTSQKGQIFIVIKNPNGGNVPVKLNFSRLNETKASTLARLYGDVLNDQTLRSKTLISLKSSNLGLFNEILKSFETELEILGNNPATININHIIEILVHENSVVDKAIIFTTDIEKNPVILFNGGSYNNDNINDLGIALQSKYHNVITITKEKSTNENLNFKNPIYLKYLFDNGIVSTNLDTEGHAFKQFTTKEENPGERKNVGSELWIGSSVQKSVESAASTITTTLNNVPNNIIADIEKKRQVELNNELTPEQLSFFIRDTKKVNGFIQRTAGVAVGERQSYFSFKKEIYKKKEKIFDEINAKYDTEIANLNKAEVKPVINNISKQDLINSKIDEYNQLVTDILSKRKEGQDSIKGPDYMIDINGNLIQGDIVSYTDEGIVVDGGLESYDMIKEFISETIENNYENILQSQKNVVSLQPVTLTNNMDTPGTQDNIDYKKAFNDLKVEGDNLLLQEGLERTLNVAVKNAELFKTTNPSVVPKFEKIISETTTKLIELADTIKKQQKC